MDSIAHNLHERPQQFKDVREKVEQLSPWLMKLRDNLTIVTTDVEPEEQGRLTELAR